MSTRFPSSARGAAVLGVTAALLAGAAHASPAFASTDDHRAAGHTSTRAGVNSLGMSPNSKAFSVAKLTTSETNQKTAFDYFVSKGLTKVQAAAIVGNLIQESGVNPASNQAGGPGRGIAQWSEGGRWDHDSKDNMKWFVATKGGALEGLGTQLNFVWYELTTFSHFGLGDLKKASTIDSAVNVLETKYEGCGKCVTSNRVKYANAVYQKYGNGTAPQSAFAVSSSSSESDIKALQYLLRAYGIDTQVDGSYGPGTTKSVKVFQSRRKMSQDGSAGPATMAALTGGSNVRVTAGWENANTVKAAEVLLLKVGYGPWLDSAFDAADVNRVKDFQKKHKLSVTGAVDANTWKALFTTGS